MRKYSKTEKTIIALADLQNYSTYDCPKDGVYQVRNDIENHTCLYCKKESPKIENVAELQEQFKKELKFE